MLVKKSGIYSEQWFELDGTSEGDTDALLPVADGGVEKEVDPMLTAARRLLRKCNTAQLVVFFNAVITRLESGTLGIADTTAMKCPKCDQGYAGQDHTGEAMDCHYCDGNGNITAEAFLAIKDKNDELIGELMCRDVCRECGSSGLPMICGACSSKQSDPTVRHTVAVEPKKRLKPLEWVHGIDNAWGRSPLDIYRIRIKEGQYQWSIEENAPNDWRPCDSIDHGKQLCQADYEKRVDGLFESEPVAVEPRRFQVGDTVRWKMFPNDITSIIGVNVDGTEVVTKDYSEKSPSRLFELVTPAEAVMPTEADEVQFKMKRDLDTRKMTIESPQLVPWESLAEVPKDAWFHIEGCVWGRIEEVDETADVLKIGGNGEVSLDEMIGPKWEYTLDPFTKQGEQPVCYPCGRQFRPFPCVKCGLPSLPGMSGCETHDREAREEERRLQASYSD